MICHPVCYSTLQNANAYFPRQHKYLNSLRWLFYSWELIRLQHKTTKAIYSTVVYLLGIISLNKTLEKSYIHLHLQAN